MLGVPNLAGVGGGGVGVCGGGVGVRGGGVGVIGRGIGLDKVLTNTTGFAFAF